MSDVYGRVVATSPSEPHRHHASLPGATTTRNSYSIASDEVGESSSRNSEQLDRSVDDGHDPVDTPHTALGTTSQGRGRSHRSHRSRSSGGFLLSDATLLVPQARDSQFAPPRKRQHRRDNKGKVKARSPDREQVETAPSTTLADGRSPLDTRVRYADARGAPGSAGPRTGENIPQVTVGKDAQMGLDVDSAQIVNLALNLSQSRRQAAKMVTAAPSPPAISGFEDSFAGGSLRQHLQAQRRSTRNISPKPDKGEKFGAQPRLIQPERAPSSLQTPISQDVEPSYHFSAATLARAEKAKNAFELMAQYRRLLQYLPPLKSQGLSRVSTASPPSTSSGVPVRPSISLSRASTTTNKPPGRPYNPLQYIRNRKVRARERQPIDGESQGFGDVGEVTAWVDRVAKQCRSDGYESHDCVELPPLLPEEEESQAHASVGSDPIKPAAPPVKVKRPRIDWMINAPDMLADVVWLEKSDNKKLIEDNRERKIFPPSTNLVRLTTRASEEQPRHQEQQQYRDDAQIEQERPPQPPDVQLTKPEDLHVDTKLPSFNSIRRPGRGGSDGNRPRIPHKLHKVARKLDSAGPLKAHGVSDSDSSDSEDSRYNARLKRGRSDKANSYGLNRDILEKQMSSILAHETDEEMRDTPENVKTKKAASSLEATPPPKLSKAREEPDSVAAQMQKPRHHRPHLHRRHWSADPGDGPVTRGRSSLEVPGQRPSEWLGSDLDSTAPNSPESKATKLLNTLIPNISMDLSPPHSPSASPSRHRPLERVRSKINRLRERSAEPLSRPRKGELHVDTDLKPSLRDSPGSPLDHIRSPSPRKRPVKGATDHTVATPTTPSIGVQGHDDERSGHALGKIKSRNPMARVGDLLWRKEEPSPSEKQYDTAPEDTDNEENAVESNKDEPQSSDRNSALRDHSRTRGGASRKVKALLDEMTTLISPTDRRGWPTHAKSATHVSPEFNAQIQQQKDHEKRRQERLDRLKLPRIDIHRASGESSPISRSRDRSPQGSLLGVHSADARLNSILNIPPISPMQKDFLPVTGLANLEPRRTSPVSERHWSLSSREASAIEPTRITRQDVARVRALLLSSGIKAKELTRRYTELRDVSNSTACKLAGVTNLAPDLSLPPLPRVREHVLAARVLEEDMRCSARAWQASAEAFSQCAVPDLLGQVTVLQERLEGSGGLSEQGKRAADEADELAREVMGSQMLRAKALAGAMDTLMRRRRRRFRWARRGGWVLVEWVLVGVMWWAWSVVVLLRLVRGLFRGVIGVLRWLFWL